jgi:tetratricopeptide (TPR) repeat protein
LLEEAVQILHGLPDRQRLAAALIDLGNIQITLQDLRSLEVFDEAVAIYRGFVYDDCRAELAGQLANAYNSQSCALELAGRQGRALQCVVEAIAIYRRQAAEKATGAAESLGMALGNQCLYFDELARFAEAVCPGEEAIAVLRPLMPQASAAATGYLCSALTNTGDALAGLARCEEALKLFDEAIALRQRLVETEGERKFGKELAWTLMCKGAALARLCRLPEAIAAHDESFATYRKRIADGQPEAAYDMALVLIHKGQALELSGRLPDADECYRPAINVLLNMAQQGRAATLPRLVKALRQRHCLLRRQGSAAEASQVVDLFKTSAGPAMQNSDPAELLVMEYQAFLQNMDN